MKFTKKTDEGDVDVVIEHLVTNKAQGGLWRQCNGPDCKVRVSLSGYSCSRCGKTFCAQHMHGQMINGKWIVQNVRFRPGALADFLDVEEEGVLSRYSSNFLHNSQDSHWCDSCYSLLTSEKFRNYMDIIRRDPNVLLNDFVKVSTAFELWCKLVTDIPPTDYQACFEVVGEEERCMSVRSCLVNRLKGTKDEADLIKGLIKICRPPNNDKNTMVHLLRALRENVGEVANLFGKEQLEIEYERHLIFLAGPRQDFFDQHDGWDDFAAGVLNGHGVIEKFCKSNWVLKKASEVWNTHTVSMRLRKVARDFVPENLRGTMFDDPPPPAVAQAPDTRP